MSAPRNYERQCRGKRTYQSKGDAKTAIRRSATKYGAPKDYARLQPYRCPHCGWWHYGHKPRRSH